MTAPARTDVAVLCDFLEEGWPSMDLVGDMLVEHLRRDHASSIGVTQIRPAFATRFGHLPLVPRRAAWNADRLLNRFGDYPRYVRRIAPRFELFHIVDHSYAQLARVLPADRVVVTCHDLDTFRSVLEPQRAGRGRAFTAMARRVLDGVRRAARVTCDSAATRAALLAYDVLPAERTVVVPNGVHPSCTPAPHADADAAAARLLGPTHPDDAELLHVGSTIPRKRIDVLLRTIAAVRAERPRTRLVRVGGDCTAEQWSLARTLHLQDAIRVLPPLSRDVLAAVYRRAALVLQPSDAEGFGLPVVEAMACGTPVVASDLPVLREVGGEAADYCAVGDVEAWRALVVARLDERRDSPERWRTRRAACLTRAAAFTWGAYASRMVDVYRAVLDG